MICGVRRFSPAVVAVVAVAVVETGLPAGVGKLKRKNMYKLVRTNSDDSLPPQPDVGFLLKFGNKCIPKRLVLSSCSSANTESTSLSLGASPTTTPPPELSCNEDVLVFFDQDPAPSAAAAPALASSSDAAAALPSTSSAEPAPQPTSSEPTTSVSVATPATRGLTGAVAAWQLSKTFTRAKPATSAAMPSARKPFKNRFFKKK